ncbi:MAG: alkaline phosphatase family protein [Anaerolineae bacterium]
MGVLLIFLDGVGIGPADTRSNPFMHAAMPTLHRLLDGGPPVLGSGPVVSGLAALVPADATLGVSGLPQSGTGQTALLTGVNAPRNSGKHHGPYPDESTRVLLQEHSLFRRLTEAGRRVVFANAYPDRYHERMARGTGRASAIARAAQMAGMRLRGPGDLRAGQALSPFLTNQGWRDHLGYTDMPVISVEEAGRRLAKLAAGHDFTLFEYYHTDMAGHRGVRARILEVLEQVDQFLGAVIENIDDETVVLVTSDHGNVEDWSTTDHTLNPAFLMAVGSNGVPAWAAGRIAKITDVAPAIVELLEIGD